MRKFIFILLAFAPVLFFSSCEDEDVATGRKIYQAYFNKILKDPSSFKVYSEKYTKKSGSTVEWELDYGARNSFGGMVREQVEFRTFGDMIIIKDDMFDLKDLKE